MDVRTDPPPDLWNRFVAAHPQAHILQTIPWGNLKAAFGWEAQQVWLAEEATEGPISDEWCGWMQHEVLLEEPRLLAGAQILYRSLPGDVGRLAYVPRGPLVNWDDRALVDAVVRAMAETARARGAIVLTIEPNLPDEPRWRERLSALGFVPSPLGSIQPRRTVVVDIAGDEDAILAAMNQATRRNIRLASRKGVQVRPATEADLPAFHRLMAATAARDGFGVHVPTYYERAFQLFVPRGWAQLLLAEVDGEAVAALMVFALGRWAWYFYGASGNAHRDKKPNHLLQWEAIRWARALGCNRYDLWGIPDEDEEKLEADFAKRQDGLWGVYRFKRGFGGQVTRTVGAWDLPLQPLMYRLYTIAVRLRRVALSSSSHEYE